MLLDSTIQVKRIVTWKTNGKKWWRGCERVESSAGAGRKGKGSQLVKLELLFNPAIPFPCVDAKDLLYHRDTCIFLLIDELFTIAKKWSQPFLQTVKGRINAHTAGFRSSVKKNEMTFPGEQRHNVANRNMPIAATETIDNRLWTSPGCAGQGNLNRVSCSKFIHNISIIMKTLAGGRN